MRHLTQALITINTLLAIAVAAPHGTSYNNIQHQKRDDQDQNQAPNLATKVEAELHPFPHPHHHYNHDHHHGHGHHGKPPQPPPKKRKFGISYSPYNTDSTCKSQDEVNADIDRLVSASLPQPENAEETEDSDYGFIRIYGIDCNQTATVTTAAKQHNLRVFAGIFDLSDFPHSLDAIIDVAHSHTTTTSEGGEEDGWSIFHTIAIGNELVQTHQSTIPDVISALHQARSILRSAGYNGPVVTVDTYTMLLEHPELCEASDYCAVNCHVFFDATQTPDKAGDYAVDVARRISEGTEGRSGGRKRTVIAESGWPHDGVANGKAVPSGENQRVAVESLKRVFREQPGEGEDDGDAGLVLFTAFDDLWKVDNEGTFGAERFWGINR